MNRSEMLDRLNRLLPAQFDDLVCRMSIPSQYLSSPNTPQAIRSTEVIQYVEQQNLVNEFNRQITTTEFRVHRYRIILPVIAGTAIAVIFWWLYFRFVRIQVSQDSHNSLPLSDRAAAFAKHASRIALLVVAIMLGITTTSGCIKVFLYDGNTPAPKTKEETLRDTVWRHIHAKRWPLNVEIQSAGKVSAKNHAKWRARLVDAFAVIDPRAFQDGLDSSPPRENAPVLSHTSTPSRSSVFQKREPINSDDVRRKIESELDQHGIPAIGDRIYEFTWHSNIGTESVVTFAVVDEWGQPRFEPMLSLSVELVPTRTATHGPPWLGRPKLTFRNGFGITCAEVGWSLRVNSSGCRIDDPEKPHSRPPDIYDGQCPFWSVKATQGEAIGVGGQCRWPNREECLLFEGRAILEIGLAQVKLQKRIQMPPPPPLPPPLPPVPREGAEEVSREKSNSSLKSLTLDDIEDWSACDVWFGRCIRATTRREICADKGPLDEDARPAERPVVMGREERMEPR